MRKINDSQLMVVFASIVLGIFARSFLPAFKKLQAGQKWDHTYTQTALTSFVISVFSAFLAFPSFSLPNNVEGILGIIAFGFIFGFGLNSAINMIVDLPTPSTSTTPPPQSPPQTQPPGTPAAILRGIRRLIFLQFRK